MVWVGKKSLDTSIKTSLSKTPTKTKFTSYVQKLYGNLIGRERNILVHVHVRVGTGQGQVPMQPTPAKKNFLGFKPCTCLKVFCRVKLKPNQSPSPAWSPNRPTQPNHKNFSVFRLRVCIEVFCVFMPKPSTSASLAQSTNRPYLNWARASPTWVQALHSGEWRVEKEVKGAKEDMKAEKKDGGKGMWKMERRVRAGGGEEGEIEEGFKKPKTLIILI